MKSTLGVDFYQTTAGTRPVLDWIKSFPKEDRKIIGTDLRTLQNEWPIGMPICKNIGQFKGCWELRTRTRRLKSLRIFFTVEDGKVVLLHGFTKKENQTASSDINTAAERLRRQKMRTM